MSDSGHLSDEQIVMSIDGELSGSAAVRVERHLAQCEQCLRRKRALRGAVEEIGEVLRRGVPLHGVALRTRLRVQMRAKQQGRSTERFAGIWQRILPLAVALPVLAAVAAGFVLHPVARPGQTVLIAALSEPDLQLTPGAVRAVGVSDLCREDGDDFDPEVPVSVRKAVFEKYGMSDGLAGEYQVDYLVSPQLGGTNSIENLWPEPYGAPVWNARAKDALERRLRQMVCGGEVDLASAQQAIRVDWIGAYRKYVGDVEGH